MRTIECNLPDMKYQPAACVLTRVISHPNNGIFTVDCGYKAIASDPKVLRGEIVGLSDKVEELFQSEEHWVFKMKPGYEQDIPQIGSVLYIIPTHICPTTALYPFVLVAEKGKIVLTLPPHIAIIRPSPRGTSQARAKRGTRGRQSARSSIG